MVDLKTFLVDLLTAIDNDKQDLLESGTNIKTVNNQSILGSGDIQIASGTEVVANPTTTSEDPVLTGLTINGTVYRLESGSMSPAAQEELLDTEF